MECGNTKAERMESFYYHINQILKNKEQAGDGGWWQESEAQKELARLADLEENGISDSKRMGIGTDENMIFIAYQKKEEGLFERIQKQADSMKERPESKESRIHLIFFVRDMESRIDLENRFMNFARKKDSFRCTYVLDRFCFGGNGKTDLKLKNPRRYEMIRMPALKNRINLEDRPGEGGAARPSDDAGLSRDDGSSGLVQTAKIKTGPENAVERLSAQVFTIDLYQLVSLYNQIGDRLFHNNVRIGIDEMLGVDASIRETLEKEPEQFWFKNNGVTILVEKPDPHLGYREELLLGRMGAGETLPFSVVNGAQTITVASRYCYELEYQYGKLKQEKGPEKETRQKELEARREGFRKAQVLLRVIHIAEAESETDYEAKGETPQPHNLAREISVALNRQKPIRQEDIAFTTPFIEKLARYLERKVKTGEDGFRLVRRGEEVRGYRRMELSSFARARKACIGKPGSARNMGMAVLLKMQTEKDGTIGLQQKDIFVEEWVRAGEEKEDEVFQRHYGAVWMAYQISLRYEAGKKEIEGKTPEALTVAENGKWYFTAALIELLNGFLGTPQEAWDRSRQDFTGFNSKGNKILKEPAEFGEAMKRFAEMVSLYFLQNRSKYEKLNSNLLKRDDFYVDFMREAGRRWREETEAEDIFTEENADWARFDQSLHEFARLLEISAEDSAFAKTEPEWGEIGAVILKAAGEEAADKPDLAALEALKASVRETAAAQETPLPDSPPVLARQYKWKPGGICLGNKGACKPVKSWAQALVLSTEYILQNYQVNSERLKQECSQWITEELPEVLPFGCYQKRPFSLTIDKKPYWIGTNSGTETKIRQLQILCRLAGVSDHEVCWLNEAGEEIFTSCIKSTLLD